MSNADGRKILLVEDEAFIALRGKQSLEKYGYSVIIVNSGEAALKALDDNASIDLILMDIDLGEGMDGTQSAEKILAVREIPIIFLSSHSEPDIVEKTERITSYGYVVKNSNIAVLDASIKMAFRLFAANAKVRHELSERKIIEEQINKQNAELENRNRLINTLLDTVPIGIFMVEAPTGRPIVANVTAKNLLGRGILPDVTEFNISEVYEAYKSGTSDRYPTQEMPIIRGMRGESSHIDDMMVIRPDGTKTLLEIYGSPVLDHRNQIAASLVSFMDITGRRNAEEEIKKQLLEKETLLKEVHHRIKNNISSIECLLALQADASDNSDAKTALHEAISRIQSIRILYDKLLIENDYQNISIKHYAENLVDSIVEMFTENKNVIVEKRIIDFTISSKKVIPLGIIINELLTNVFKYAFKGKENGRVVIEIEKDEQRITLTIRDDGVGIETADNAVKPQGFGLTIVKMLTEQLNGTYTFENDNGTKSAVVFEL